MTKICYEPAGIIGTGCVLSKMILRQNDYTPEPRGFKLAVRHSDLLFSKISLVSVMRESPWSEIIYCHSILIASYFTFGYAAEVPKWREYYKGTKVKEASLV